MILFYCADLTGDRATLADDEFHHCCKVLRHSEGDLIHVTDGQGTRATATIQQTKKREAILNIESKEEFEQSDQRYYLAIAPPKNRSRWEWLIEKAVEIGVDKIIPLQTHHSERKKINAERSEKIMRSAALQCLRPYHPELTATMDLKSLFKSELSTKANKFIAHFHIQNESLVNQEKPLSNSLVLIGPEGDFSETEIEQCKGAGFTTVNISVNRLRTETAGIVAITQLLSSKV